MAASGCGAYKQQKGQQTSLTTSGRKEIQGTLGAMSIKSNTFPIIKDMLKLGAHGMRSTGAAALMLCELAAGSVDWYCHEGIHAWDYCAGAVIVQEAGGICMDMNLRGELDIFNRRFFAISSQTLRDELAKKINIEQYLRT